MSISEVNSLFSKKEQSFWRRTLQYVPGSIAPACITTDEGVTKDNVSMPCLQTEVLSEVGDQDLYLETFHINISQRAVHSAAAKVLLNHSEQQKLSAVTSLSGGSMTQALSQPVLHSDSASGINSRLMGPGIGIRTQDAADAMTSCQNMEHRHERLKLDKFLAVINADSVNLDELRKISWSGIPSKVRPLSWKLLAGYVSPILDRRMAMLNRKRQEYHNFVKQYYSTRYQDVHQDTYRQIHIDIPRMSPLIPLFQQHVIQQVFERILYIWSIRHPASGYVQGINDLVTPFFVVFLSEYLDEGSPFESCQLHLLSSSDIQNLEADCFWCFSKLLDGIQDNYTFAQPGIQIRVNCLKELVSRIDSDLHHHLEYLNVEYLQFAFRWMNNLLMREFPLRCVIRLWDTYLCELNGLASFHLYVCVSFLTRFSDELQKEHDFHGLLVLLQCLPTEYWTDDEINLVLAEAYRLKFMFADAPMHLKYITL